MSARRAALVSDNDGGTWIFENKNLLGVIVLVKRDRLSGCQCLGKYEEIFGVAELTIDLDRERYAAEWPRAVHEVITLILLQDEWNRSSACLFCVVGSFVDGLSSAGG